MPLRRSARVQTQAVATEVGQAIKSATPARKRSQPDTAVNDSTHIADEHAQKDDGSFIVPGTPSPAKRRRANPVTPHRRPPVTPTPSAVKVMMTPQASYSTGDIDDAVPSQPSPRPASPHHTNAPLSTPNGGRVLILPDNRDTIVPEPRSTNLTLLEDAKRHLLRVSPSLAPVVAAHACPVFSPAGLGEPIDPFRSLASGIMAQQVSGAAASSIKNKFIGLFPAGTECPGRGRAHPGPPTFPSPEMVAATELTRLREAGLSARKAEYIKGLAENFARGELSAGMLSRAGDEEVMERLVAVRGLGKWSVEMFCCFGLKRMDVFSTGDLGVQRGMAAFVGRDVNKLKNKGGKWKYMSEQEMVDIAEKYRPYRSLFMWYMWRVESVLGQGGGTNVDAMQSTL